MSATGLPAFWPMFEPRMPGFLHIDAPDPYRFVNPDPTVSLGVAAANQLEEAILREGPDTVAAFIAEPVQGAGGVIVPPRRLLPAHPRDLHQVRRAADRRRSDHRLRAHRALVRPRALRRRARHHAVRQGHHQRLHPARRHRRVGHDPRRDQRRAAGQALDARLHLLRPSDLLRRGAGQHRHPRARGAGRARGRRRRAAARRGCARSSRWTASATCAGWG